MRRKQKQNSIAEIFKLNRGKASQNQISGPLPPNDDPRGGGGGVDDDIILDNDDHMINSHDPLQVIKNEILSSYPQSVS